MQLISKAELLDKDKDKDKIKKINKQLEQDFKKIDYAIDLNTGKVKRNTNYIYIVDTPPNKDKDKTTNSEIMQLLQNDYIKDISKFKTTISKYLETEYTTTEQLNKDIQKFNKYFYQKYLNGFNLRVIDFLNDEIKASYLGEYTNSILFVKMQELSLYGIDKFLKSDLAQKIQEINNIIDNSDLKKIQKEILKKLPKIETKETTETDKRQMLIDIMYNAVYKKQEQIINKRISDNKGFYDKVHLLYNDINNTIINIVNRFKGYCNELDTKKNYDVVKFSNNNDISTKLDPIAKTLLNGKYYKTDEIIKADNNHNDKSYGAVFSIKATNLSNIDIIDELKAKGVKINHFGKKIIDDIDLLIEENKGNITNDNKLVALTPKMIARKVYNKEQPTKKQIQEIEDNLHYLSNIYLFFVKDDKTADAISKLKILKDKGIEILQDKDGNILNIGDTLDDNLILNAKFGYSVKYKSVVFVFDNKSMFYRVNQQINNETEKQLITSTKDSADSVFKDYNKNVNDSIVGTRYYLYERVNQIKHNIVKNTKTNKEILLSNIYNEYDIKEPKQKAVLRKAIVNTLNYWVDINYISGFRFLDNKGNDIPKNSTKEIYKLELDV